MLKRFIRRLLPSHVYSSILQRARRQLKPVHWGNLRRLSPIGTLFGTNRGQPIDRYYIDTARMSAALYWKLPAQLTH